jgi:hypothetical protein
MDGAKRNGQVEIPLHFLYFYQKSPLSFEDVKFSNIFPMTQLPPPIIAHFMPTQPTNQQVSSFLPSPFFRSFLLA